MRAAICPPRRFQPLFGRLPEMMDTGRVAADFGQRFRKIAQHFRRDRGRRVVIEIKVLHLSTSVPMNAHI